MKTLFIFLFFFPIALNAQSNSFKEIQEYQTELKNSYLNKETTPLNQDEQKDFKGITFFDINEKYIVEAELELLNKQKAFVMPSTGKVKQKYKKYGILHFKIGDEDFQLIVYQNIALSKQEGYEKHLFLPFYDLTNGETTYGGGRYLDIQIPDSNKLIIDFNQAYNPYCAYSVRYSCPITPQENFLNTEIKAGVTYSNNEI